MVKTTHATTISPILAIPDTRQRPSQRVSVTIKLVVAEDLHITVASATVE
ncbi:MAG: hypothetical protein GY719_20425 [bacterium]|nr:hypothetical protein [bacterium]